jgi:pimeloyl-ACP methyl ester carboxylesterase
MSAANEPSAEAAPQPTSAFATLNGWRFHFLDWGNEAAPPVLLLHGFTGHARQWDFEARALRSKFHVVALDQRGHGDSDAAKVYGTLPMVDDLAAFVDDRGFDRVSLVGLSMGGVNAFHYTAQHPDRVERLVLGDIGPEVAPEGLQRIRTLVASRDTFASVDDAFEFLASNNPRATEWALRHRVAHNLRALPDGTLTWKYDRALRDGTAARMDVTPDEQWARWRAIAVPTLVVRGAESDILSVEVAQRMLEEQPNAELVTIDGAGHTVTTDQPEAFLAAIDGWLCRRQVEHAPTADRS